MRPTSATAKAANILLLRMNNTSGITIPRLQVVYDFANPESFAEEVPGWQAYYSVNGNTGWIKIPEFSSGATGQLSANLDFGGAGWAAGANVYLLWVDDNAAADNESSYTMDNLAITVPCSLSATVANGQRTLGADPSDPSDDLISFDVTVNAINPPVGSAGWKTTSAVPSPVATGAYGSTFTISNLPPTALPLILSLEDQLDPNCKRDVAVTAAILPKYAGLNLIGTPAFVLLDTASATQWASNGALMNVVQNNGGGTVPYVASTVPVTFAAGSTKFVSLTLETQDASGGTNLETEDVLKVELVTDAGSRVLTGLFDKNHSGFINGYSTSVAVPYDTQPLLDEFNRFGIHVAGTFNNQFHLHGLIPAEATTAHLVITGLNNSLSETYRVQEVRFGVAVDTDGDGKYDSEEAVEGTDPNLASSHFRLLQQDCTAGTYSLMVPTLSGRNYQLDTSTDLIIWTPQSVPITGTDANMVFTTPCSLDRKFARIIVQP